MFTYYMLVASKYCGEQWNPILNYKRNNISLGSTLFIYTNATFRESNKYYLGNKIYDHSLYTMDHPNDSLSNQKEESIST